jgi:hypothetical protein
MPRKPSPKQQSKWDDPEESKRFLETARVVEASNDPKDFERALTRILPKPKPRIGTRS